MPIRRLSPDEALIALLIAAMESSGHVAPVEAARAAELVRLMPQFRRHARPVIGRMIERMKAYVRDHDDAEIIAAAREAIPVHSRGGAYFTVAAVLLSDHRLQRGERAFLLRLSADLLPAHLNYRRPDRKMPRLTVPNRQEHWH